VENCKRVERRRTQTGLKAGFTPLPCALSAAAAALLLRAVKRKRPGPCVRLCSTPHPLKKPQKNSESKKTLKIAVRPDKIKRNINTQCSEQHTARPRARSLDARPASKKDPPRRPPAAFPSTPHASRSTLLGRRQRLARRCDGARGDGARDVAQRRVAAAPHRRLDQQLVAHPAVEAAVDDVDAREAAAGELLGDGLGGGAVAVEDEDLGAAADALERRDLEGGHLVGVWVGGGLLCVGRWAVWFFVCGEAAFSL